MNHLPYQRPRRHGPRATATTWLAAAALATTLALGAATWTHASGAPTPPTWGHGGSAFGTLPSTGDAVADCGEMADTTEGRDLPDAAVEALEMCLDLHGWEYDAE